VRGRNESFGKRINNPCRISCGEKKKKKQKEKTDKKRRRNEGRRCWVFGKVHISLAVVVHWILGIPVLLLFRSLEQRHCTLGQQREGRKEGRKVEKTREGGDGREGGSEVRDGELHGLYGIQAEEEELEVEYERDAEERTTGGRVNRATSVSHGLAPAAQGTAQI
jgi:hypothetical protein